MAATSTTIGTSMISSVLLPMVNRAASVALDQCDVMVNINREINSLKRTLHAVNKILQEAEERQIDDINVRESLRDLLDIGYEARDVLDEFLTAVSINANRTSRSVMFDYCLPLISFFLRCFGIGGSSSTVQVVLPLKLRFRLANDVKSIKKRLDEIMVREEIARISKDVGGGGFPERQRPENSPFADKQRDLFVGRKQYEEEIMKKLRNNNDKRIHVAVICGMGGLGKTTLAQSIYNEYPTKNKHWLCVGVEKYTAKEIMLKIINERDIDNNLGRIQEKFVGKLTGDRFLIVLDDIWNVDNRELNLLLNPLTYAGNGGMIIITTRMKDVITTFNTQVQYELKPLSDDDCWLIFESYAFVDGNSNTRPDLKCIGREIVEKLKGLPLAAEVVGRSLFNEPDERIWKKFLEAQEWKLRNKDDIDVMPALRWSYNRLLPHLKQCFVYCSLFPKDHVFDKKLLVEMWMAHGYIQNAGGVAQTKPEDVGAQYFKDLVNASLFQCIDYKYVMHDMIHDLALLVSNEEFATTNGLLSTDKMEKVRHITINHDDDYMKNLSLCKSKRILTLYTANKWHREGESHLHNDIVEDVLKNLKSIRVLVLCSSKITDIPNCIGELIHLRYLDVEITKVKSLPDSLCNLHNLQMLAAPLEAVLPKDIVNVHNLRYIRANLPTCRGVVKLTSLRELSSISVCEDDNIGVLGNMGQLRGSLTIKGLENITSLQDAAEALMEEKEHIDGLTLVFNRDLRKATISASVLLDALKCPPKLTHLKIVGYDDPEPPRWIADGKFVANVQTLELSQYNQLEFLVPLGEMRSLEDLKIDYCKKLTAITPAVCFPTAIKTLIIEFCDKMTVMEFGSLPSLRFLAVGFCNELISISGLVGVKKLNLERCEKLKSVSTNFQLLDSIEDLYIFNCPLLELICDSSSSSSTLLSSSPWSRLESLDIDNEYIFRNIFEQDLVSIQNLTIRATIVFECFEEIMKNSCDKLKSIKSLYIFSCDQLLSLPHSLEHLVIKYCPELQSLPANGLPPSLRTLEILGCRQLQSLPADGLPPSLRYLQISGCPMLYERCKDESGLDWHKIKHIHERIIELYIW